MGVYVVAFGVGLSVPVFPGEGVVRRKQIRAV